MDASARQAMPTPGFAEASLPRRRIDEAEAAVHAAVDELLSALRPTSRPSSDTAAGRVLAEIAGLRRMLAEGSVGGAAGR